MGEGFTQKKGCNVLQPFVPGMGVEPTLALLRTGF